jgi:hypothetical protein
VLADRGGDDDDDIASGKLTASSLQTASNNGSGRSN